jgi:hypothetical protein
MIIAGETEVFSENLLQCQFVHHKSHVTWSGLERGPRSSLSNSLLSATDSLRINYVSFLWAGADHRQKTDLNSSVATGTRGNLWVTLWFISPYSLQQKT